MAGKLGNLTIDIAADVAHLRQDMARAERTVGKATDNMARSARRVGTAFGTIAGALIGGAAVRSIVQATAKQEAAVKQLEQGLASTGNLVGQSLDQLTAKAAALQKVTTFGDEDIIAAQSQLVTFTKITGEEFDKTIELAADLSTRMGGDLKGSVLQLGKALNDPVKNLSALSRAGIQFDESQISLIKSLVASGDQIAAQKIILKELETQFGGSARAARDTFGGAIDALKNSFGDLLENDGGLNQSKRSIEELNSLISDPEFVASVNTLTSGLIAGFTNVASAIAGTVNITRTLAEGLAELIHGPLIGDIDGLHNKLVGLQEARAGKVKLRNEATSGFNRAQYQDEIDALDIIIAKENEKLRLSFEGAKVRAAAAKEIKADTEAGATGGTGLGSTAPTGPTDDQQKQAAAIFDQTRTAAEKYEEQYAKLKELKDADAISQETANRALQGYAEALAAANPAIEEFKELQAARAEKIASDAEFELALEERAYERRYLLAQEHTQKLKEEDAKRKQAAAAVHAAVTALVGSENKKLAAFNKAAAIVQATQDGIVAVNAALKLGPIAGPIAAAATAITVGANIARLGGSGSTGAETGGGGNYATSTSSSTSNVVPLYGSGSESGSGGGVGNVNWTIQLYGDRAAKVDVDENEKIISIVLSDYQAGGRLAQQTERLYSLQRQGNR